MGLSRAGAIIGVDESDAIGHVPNKSSLQHHSEAALNALADAGLTFADVDALFCAGTSSLTVAEYLGITPKFTDSTSIGGSSFLAHVEHALAAISAGLIDVALITHGEAGRSTRGSRFRDVTLPGTQYEAPYGIVGPPIAYAMACSRYMDQYGEKRVRQGMAEVAVATRKWALKNPKAFINGPTWSGPREMSFDDYHASRWIAWPFHIADCCLVTDGGGACIVASPAVARNARKKPVWVLGSAEGHDHDIISQMPDLTRTVGAQTGPRALAMAGVTHDDLDLAMVYDSFTYTVLTSLESLGFCGPGEAPDFVADQSTAPGGAFPMNTNGGGLSYTHTGMYGMFLLIEAVRQLRGEGGDRQIANCRLALAHGTGGMLSSTATLVLGAD
jgi:acetyl-CoA acetyltransferase